MGCGLTGVVWQTCDGHGAGVKRGGLTGVSGQTVAAGSGPGWPPAAHGLPRAQCGLPRPHGGARAVRLRRAAPLGRARVGAISTWEGDHPSLACDTVACFFAPSFCILNAS